MEDMEFSKNQIFASPDHARVVTGAYKQRNGLTGNR